MSGILSFGLTGLRRRQSGSGDEQGGTGQKIILSPHGAADRDVPRLLAALDEQLREAFQRVPPLFWEEPGSGETRNLFVLAAGSEPPEVDEHELHTHRPPPSIHVPPPWRPGQRPQALPAEGVVDHLIRSDVERVWDLAQAPEGEDRWDDIEPEFALFLKRYGAAAVRAFGNSILNRVPSGETSWRLLHILGRSSNEDTRIVRRDVLAAALESRDAGLRYAAASALGELGGEQSLQALRKRLAWEKNISVRRMIEAELRG